MGEETMKFTDGVINNVADLLEALKKFRVGNEPIWFRGQSGASWKLTPSIARDARISNAEFMLIKRFKQNAMPFLDGRPKTDWDWLFLMQHHGLPTRLLDWTESPLVALYFSVNESKYYTDDGALWCLLPKALNENANYLSSHAQELPFFDVDIILNNYLPETISSERTSNLKPMAAMSLRESKRLFAQLGVFTITHREPMAIEDVGDKNHIWRLIIPKNKKSEILHELALLTINKLALFPELPSVAEVAQEILK
jgi:FRG domain